MKKEISKLTAVSIIFFSCTVVAEQSSDCTCCQLVETRVCNLAPPIAPSVNIKFDFNNVGSKTKLYAIEECEAPFEVTREKPFIRGRTNAGELTLVLCNKNKLLATKKLPITANYFSLCKVSKNIICQN